MSCQLVARLAVSLLILLYLPATSANIRIVSTEPAYNGTVTRLGELRKLSCSTDRKWFFCLWTSPGGDRQCAIQENVPSQVCKGEPRLLISGGRTNCDITISNTTRADWGDWMCLVTDDINFSTSKSLVSMEVGVGGAVSLQYPGHEDGGGVLRLTEGDRARLECHINGAYPPPTFSWEQSLLPHAEGRVRKNVEEGHTETGQQWAGLNVIEQGNNTWETGGRSVSGLSSAIYTANINHTNSTISCHVVQADRWGNQLFSSSASLLLHIDPLPTPLPVISYAQQVGIVAGVLVAVMFLLLLCILFTIFMCRREKRSRASSPRSSPPQQKADHQLTGSSTSSSGVWSTHASGQRPPHYHPRAPVQQLPVLRFQPMVIGRGGRRASRPDGMHESLCDSEESGHSSLEQPRQYNPELSLAPTANLSNDTTRQQQYGGNDYDDDSLSGIINYNHRQNGGGDPKAKPRVHISPTSSKSASSVSPSASSHASFETERSVGEIDRSSGSCVILHPAPSLHETHFGLGPEEDPLTILHPPGSGLRWAGSGSIMGLDPDALPGRKISCTKSEGRAALLAAAIGQQQQLPLSSYYYLPGSRPASTLGLVPGDGASRLPQRLSTPTCPGSLLSTAAASASSVFQCQHDCFLLEHSEQEQQQQQQQEQQLEAVVQQIAQQFHQNRSQDNLNQSQ